jgi:crotonobetainyl-CoA:carnitine CoA-transferase CaiB-like acyl-CoA transferase
VSGVSRPLSHIRVLDLSRVLAGPWCTQLLADLGAEVIKIERPGSGDETRAWGPPWLDGTKESAYFLSCNRGKKSVTVDMDAPGGREILRDLAACSDVVVENFKVGALARRGLDYPSLKAIKPDIVYCSITGFGQDGPEAHRAGYDFIIQGMGGLMSLTGEPGGMPMKAGVAFADVFTGVYAANAIQAALIHRDRTGAGSHIDMALLDVQVAVLANQALNYLVSGAAPFRLGNAHPNIAPYQAFAASDGHVIIAVGNDGQFARLCQAMGRPDLASDGRFATNAARVAHREELIPVLAERVAARPTAEWLALLEEAGVPAAPINTLDQAFAEPQVRHRGMTISLPHGSGSVKLVRCPIRADGFETGAETAPPLLGEHTEEVLKGVLGLDDEDISELRARGAI